MAGSNASIDVMAEAIVRLACRSPLRAEVHRAYTDRLLARFSERHVSRATLLQLLDVQQIVLLAPPHGLAPCTAGVAVCSCEAKFALSCLTRTYDIRTCGTTCLAHAVKVMAAHFLLTLPDRAAAGGSWSADAVRAALHCIMQ